MACVLDCVAAAQCLMCCLLSLGGWSSSALGGRQHAVLMFPVCGPDSGWLCVSDVLLTRFCESRHVALEHLSVFGSLFVKHPGPEEKDSWLNNISPYNNSLYCDHRNNLMNKEIGS